MAMEDGDRARLTRRALLTRGGAAGFAVLGGPSLLAACTSPQAAPQASASAAASAPAATAAATTAPLGGTLTTAWHLDAYSSTLGSALDPHGLPGGVPWWYLWEQGYDPLLTAAADLRQQ